jgi:hypothetical protein
MLGPEVSDFTMPIARQARADGFEVDALELRGLPPEPRRGAYDALLEAPSLSLRAYPPLSLARGTLQRDFWGDIASRFHTAPLDAAALARHVPEALRTALAARALRPTFADYDIVNFHLLSDAALRYLRFVPSAARVVLSFWGSDLYRQPFPQSAVQYRALKRADRITLNTPEMREVLLAKFGRHLSPKVETVLFGLDPAVIHAIQTQRKEDARTHFLASHGLDPTVITVAIGYNASTEQRQAEVIQELAKLPLATRQRLALVLPMTYGGSVARASEMLDAARGLSLCAIALTEFLSVSELATLRLACDVAIHVPDSDAISASLVEFMWAGAVPIIGSWLPYGQVRAAGAFMREVGSLGDVPIALTDILTDLANHRARAQGNSARLGFLMASEQARKWVAIYRSVLDPQQRQP